MKKKNAAAGILAGVLACSLVGGGVLAIGSKRRRGRLERGRMGEHVRECGVCRGRVRRAFGQRLGLSKLV